MPARDRDLALKGLYDAFSSVEKPVPLATFDGSHCDEEVTFFNAIDWEEATYSEVSAGMEGLIICPAPTRLWLLPRLFRMVMMRKSGQYDGAVDNLAETLETWIVDLEVEALLTTGQKRAILAGWAYLDTHLYHPSGSHVARELARHWGMTTP